MIDVKEQYRGQNIFLYLPEREGENLLVIEEGTGDNLLKEDIAEGYVDYLNWNSCSMTLFADSIDMPEAEFSPVDGGMVLLRTYAQSMTVEEVISAALKEFGYDRKPVIL